VAELVVGEVEPARGRGLVAKHVIEVSGSPVRCPYCHDAFTNKELIACAGCSARHHALCYAEQGACASCGSAEALYPQRRASDPSARPPEGSRLRVERSGRQVAYRWRIGTNADRVLACLFCILLLPLAPLWIYLLSTPREREIVVEPEWIELPVRGFWGTTTQRLSRAQVGAVQVTPAQGRWVLWIDKGLERLAVTTDDFNNCSLSAPELEWIASRIQQWRDAA